MMTGIVDIGREGPLAANAAIIAQALEILASQARAAGFGVLAESILAVGIEAAETARSVVRLAH